MSEDKQKEEFLSRWSRLKRQATETPAAPAPAPAAPAADAKAAPELPPVEELTMDSDFRGFFHPKVSEDLRRTALKKLFSDPHFNVMDGLDTYIDDYSKSDPLPAAMLAQLKQAQKIIEWAKEKKEDVQEGTVAGAAALPAENEALPPAAQAASALNLPEQQPMPPVEEAIVPPADAVRAAVRSQAGGKTGDV